MDAALNYIEARGEARGTILGMEKINRLGIMLSESGRTGDFLKSLSDRAFQKKLLIEFGLEEEN